MELPTFPSIFAFLLFLFTLIIAKLLKTKNKKKNLPSGPWKLPIIGNIHQLLGSSLPHHSLANLEYGPLMQLQLGEVPIVIISSAEGAKEVMKTHDITFAQRPSLLATSIIYNSSGIAFCPYGSYWRMLRKLCTAELLSPKRVQSFRSIREEEVTNLIKTISLAGNSPINLSNKIFLVMHSIISRAASGKKCRHKEEFVSTITQILSLASGFSIAEMYPSFKMLELMSGLRPKIEKLHKQFDRIIENIIDEHKSELVRNGGEVEEDLIHVLLKIQERGDLEFPLSDDNVKAIILDVFAGGGETSASTVEWAMSELLKNPSLMKKTQEEVRQVFSQKGTVDETRLHELVFLKSVIKETLRLHPPVSLIPRECSTNCEINGYNILAKTKILINTWAIGRDSKYWTKAERFNPERFINTSINYKGMDFEYLPFGSGRRICPGILMGLVDVELPLAQLLYHFDWKIPNDLKNEEFDMTEANGLTISKKNNLYLIPIPYHPSSLD